MAAEADATEFELIDYPPTNNNVGSPANVEEITMESSRHSPLSEVEFLQLFDKEGRIIDEHRFHQAVFRGGVDSSIRRQVWLFLFSFYPFHSTTTERKAILHQKSCRYSAMKSRWQQFLLQKWPAFDISNPENCLVEGKPQFNVTISSYSVAETKRSTDIAALEAQIIALRLPCDIDNISESLRYISKDVPRTERAHPLFKFNGVNHVALRDMLMTFCLLHPEIGYVQGMNDIIARFYIVFGSEVLAFWCFNNYVEYVQKDFLAVGMVRKIEVLKRLLKQLDPDLYQYLASCGGEDLVFCHKWLLLCFQREFELEDGLKLLEILSTHHLEITSPQAQKAFVAGQRQDFESNGVQLTPGEMAAESDFTFDLFVCVAVLIDFRQQLFRCTESYQIFQTLSQVSGKLVLDRVLCQAEKLFLSYCRHSVLDSFVILP